MSISSNNFVGESDDDDSGTNIISDGDDYYQPISAVDDSTSDLEEEEHVFNESNEGNSISSIPPWGIPNHCHGLSLANGHTRGMSLNEEETEDGETSEAEEEERIRREAIRRAFREDESRRNARLPRGNATRIMNAMRGISFGGFTPVWADQVPEHQWINQLERLRLQTPNLSAANQEN